MEPGSHTHANTKGVDCTACASKNASVSNVVCVCNINIENFATSHFLGKERDIWLKEG